MILGLGCIGRALAGLLRRHGLTVLGVSRNPENESAAQCDSLFGPEDWQDQLQQVDLCCITLPLTKHTANLFDETVLKRLHEHAVLVNIGRSAIVDLRALRARLEGGLLGGAALDGLEPVPEPSDPLWSTPGLLITPNVAVFHPGRQADLERFIEDQVGRFLSGEELQHRVDLSRAFAERYIRP
jgi:phosphoglycerate dehydrogenase-like enzyme